MSYSDAYSAITSKFEDEWNDRIPVHWENVVFDPSDKDAWISFYAMSGDSAQASIGGSTNVFRHAGVIVAQIFTAFNIGKPEILGHVDAFCAIFRNKVFANIKTGAPNIVNVGIDQATGRYQVNVSIPYYRDESF